MRSWTKYALTGILLLGCHAKPNDPAGQAKELSDGVRRENAISNLTRIYTKALSEHNGNRETPEVKTVVDASIAELTQTYVEHPEDTQNGLRILDLLGEMRDIRALPALLKALDWQAEVNEEHAIRAAKTLAAMPIPQGERSKSVAALSTALQKVRGAKPVDNRMRIEFLRALGAIGDRGATPILVEIMARQSTQQNFLINRLAAEQLGVLADPAAVTPLIQALFLYSTGNPGIRMNDVASQTLAQIGKPALSPLLNLLAGKDDTARAIAAAYIKAIAERDPEAASQLTPQGVMATEAAYALGQLGLHEAFGPLLQETNSSDRYQRTAAALALISIEGKTPEEVQALRKALQEVYAKSEKHERPQLLVAMQHTYDAGALSFLLDQAKKPEDELPDIRVVAVQAYALLANHEEVGVLRAAIQAEPGPEEGGYRTNFEQNEPILKATSECKEDVNCWLKKLDDKNAVVARKATYMLARLGKTSKEAITALAKRFEHANDELRSDILYAMDHLALKGSPEAVAAIDAVAQKEEGRASWNRISSLARVIQARLKRRASLS